MIIPFTLARIKNGLRWRINACKIVAKEMWMLFVQTLHLKQYSREARNLIVFLTPGHDCVWGGVMSISSLCAETKRLQELKQSVVLLCTLPSHPIIAKYTQFKNPHTICPLSLVDRQFRHLAKLLVHIPEYLIDDFIHDWEQPSLSRLRNVRDIHFNIMFQNILLLDERAVQRLRQIGKTTCTTAHERYSTRAMRERLGIPLHKMSVGAMGPYVFLPYDKKSELLVVSPDPHPRKREILEEINKRMPHVTVRIISGLTYGEYLTLISKAKWSLTFGEGLDGYFAEPVLSGGVSFAVYNNDFFTPDFKELRTVYDSYDKLVGRIVDDMRSLDAKEAYSMYNVEQAALLSKYYKNDQYLDNLSKFYRGEYTYP